MSEWNKGKGFSDDWYTPKYVFDALGCSFDLDVSSPIEGPRYTPATKWLYEGSLEKEWSGFVWMNPPYANEKQKVRWLTKFFAHGNGIALMPDRTSAKWFQDSIRLSDAFLLTSRKIKFERPDGSVGESPGNGSALFAVGKAALEALKIAETRGLGIVVTRAK